MNIVVCVKYVQDATRDRKFEDDNTVDRVGVDGLLSELDEYAVEQALQFREKREGEEITVTALTVGPEKAVEKIKADAGADLVICGMASTDASGSVIPAMLAERLGLPQVTLASVVESQGDQVSSGFFFAAMMPLNDG